MREGLAASAPPDVSRSAVAYAGDWEWARRALRAARGNVARALVAETGKRAARMACNGDFSGWVDVPVLSRPKLSEGPYRPSEGPR